jgi:hypothetical protein
MAELGYPTFTAFLTPTDTSRHDEPRSTMDGFDRNVTAPGMQSGKT